MLSTCWICWKQQLGGNSAAIRWRGRIVELGKWHCTKSPEFKVIKTLSTANWKFGNIQSTVYSPCSVWNVLPELGFNDVVAEGLEGVVGWECQSRV